MRRRLAAAALRGARAAHAGRRAPLAGPPVADGVGAAALWRAALREQGREVGGRAVVARHVDGDERELPVQPLARWTHTGSRACTPAAHDGLVPVRGHVLQPQTDPRLVAGARSPHVGDKVVKEELESVSSVVRTPRRELASGALLHQALQQSRRDERHSATAPDVVARLGERRGDGAVRRRVIALRIVLRAGRRRSRREFIEPRFAAAEREPHWAEGEQALCRRGKVARVADVANPRRAARLRAGRQGRRARMDRQLSRSVPARALLARSVGGRR